MMKRMIVIGVGVLSLGVLVGSGLKAEGGGLVGKSASWETWGEEEPVVLVARPAALELETPNQKRRRLGLPVEASFPAEEIGASLETPNHRRHRLSLHPQADVQAILAQAR